MPPMNRKAVKLAVAYRKRGLGVREIARVMKKDPTQILRWFSYHETKLQNVDSYPQQGVDNKK